MISEAVIKEKFVELKSSVVDLVTETDQRVENFLITSLSKQFPHHKFIGEETTATGIKNELTHEPTWIIDPVDGTMNFVHKFPFVAVSIGLAVKKRIEVGVIFNPLLNRMFKARRGHGSFLNDEKLQVTKTIELSHALILLEMGSSRVPEVMSNVFENLQSVISSTHGIRSQGSAALNMCAVAAGEADCYYEYGIHCWDMAAGAIIVEEAGGVVIDPEGGPLDIMSRRLLCAPNMTLALDLSKKLKHIQLERD